MKPKQMKKAGFALALASLLNGAGLTIQAEGISKTPTDDSRAQSNIQYCDSANYCIGSQTFTYSHMVTSGTGVIPLFFGGMYFVDALAGYFLLEEPVNLYDVQVGGRQIVDLLVTADKIASPPTTSVKKGPKTTADRQEEPGQLAIALLGALGIGVLCFWKKMNN